jgi:hypothetical protein
MAFRGACARFCALFRSTGVCIVSWTALWCLGDESWLLQGSDLHQQEICPAPSTHLFGRDQRLLPLHHEAPQRLQLQGGGAHTRHIEELSCLLQSSHWLRYNPKPRPDVPASPQGVSSITNCPWPSRPYHLPLPLAPPQRLPEQPQRHAVHAAHIPGRARHLLHGRCRRIGQVGRELVANEDGQMLTMST